MKKLERIKSFVDIDNCDYPFRFDVSDFILLVYPLMEEIV